MTNKTQSADEMAALFRRQRAEVSGALDRLRAENARLRAERDAANERGEYYREKADDEIKTRLEYGRDLARVTAERDAAKRALHLAIETHSVDQRQIERLAKYYMEQARGPEKEE